MYLALLKGKLPSKTCISRPIASNSTPAYYLDQGKPAYTVLNPLRSGFVGNSPAVIAEVLPVTQHANQIPIHCGQLGLHVVKVQRWLETGQEPETEIFSSLLGATPIDASESVLVDEQVDVDVFSQELLPAETSPKSVRKIRPVANRSR